MIKTFDQFINEKEGREEELFNADDVKRQLKKQNASDEEINRYIKLNMNKKPGDTYSVDAGAPGIGKFVYKVTRVTDKCIYGVYLPDESDVRELDPSEVI